MQSNAFGISNLMEGYIPERLIFGRSRAMQGVREVVDRVADVSVPVLLHGESGTGKELIGKEIHRRSRWREGPFIRVASGELNITASGKQDKNVECKNATPFWQSARSSVDAPAGSIFFDEVSELNSTGQATLLGFFRNDHSGGSRYETNNHTDSRIICSTRRDLESEVAAGTFRSDLFYRINIVTIRLPNLHDRREDIPELVEYLFEGYCRRQNRTCRPLPMDILQLFCEYEWPGNIRELENCIKRYVSINGESASSALPPSSVPTDTAASLATGVPESIPLKAYRRQVAEQAEKDMILKVLREQRWNRKETARVLQISYNTLLQKLKQTGLDKKTRTTPPNSSKEFFGGRLP